MGRNNTPRKSTDAATAKGGRLRIQAGRWRGRVIHTLPDWRVRPMLDRVREALFNALHARAWLDGAFVLDVFAGTGALGLEALSRGAAHAVFFERDREVYDRLGESVQQLGVEASRVDLIHGDALRDGPRRLAPFLGASALAEPTVPVVVFLDPPYAEVRPPRAEAFWHELAALLAHVVPHEVAPRPPVLLVVGHEHTAKLPATLAGWPQRDARRYGRVCLSFYGDWPTGADALHE